MSSIYVPPTIGPVARTKSRWSNAAIIALVLPMLIAYSFISRHFEEHPLVGPALSVTSVSSQTSDVFGEQIGAIEGIVHNNTAHTISSLNVNINLYDATGNQVGSTIALGSNLEAGGNLKFGAPVFTRGAVKFKVVKVEGY